jgi:SM-20-related protein
VINGGIDFLPYSQTLAAQGFVQILGFLQAEAAESLASCLEREVPYQILIRDAHGQRALELTESDFAIASARAHAAQHFAFAYEGYQIVEHYMAGRNPDHLLHRVLEFFNCVSAVAPYAQGERLAITGWLQD